MRGKAVAAVAVSFTLLFAGSINDKPASINSLHPSEHRRNLQQVSINESYRDIISYGDKFIAVGTGGRIDRIDKSVEHVFVCKTPVNVTLNEAVADGKLLVVAGDKGTLLISEDGELFKVMNTGTGCDFNSIIVFNRLLITASDSGILFLSDDRADWTSFNLQVKGNIVSLSADSSKCAGVTDAGEIILSDDGLSWEIFDYNETYKGFARPCRFRKVLVAGKRIAVAGVHDDGTPAVLFSTMGKVWTERILHYTDMNGLNGFLKSLPNDIAYDPEEDQFLIACDNGEVITLPPCSKCNILFRPGIADLYAVTYSDNLAAVAGSGYFFRKTALR